MNEKIEQKINFFKASKDSRINLYGKLSDEEKIAIVIVTQSWAIAHNWVIKLEWDSKFKLLVNRKTANAYKPWGLLLISIYNLCERSHGMQEKYKNAGEWFNKIFLEIVEREILNVYKPPKVYNNNIKKSLLDEKRKISRKLRNNENPFYHDEALSLLIETAFILKESNNLYRKNYWLPFLKTYSAYVRDLASDQWGRGFVENGKFYCQMGRGGKNSGRVFMGTVENYKNIFETLATQGL